MAAIVIRGNTNAAALAGVVGLRAKACRMVQRAMAYAAAAVMVCAVGAALLQLVAQMLSFPAPIAVTGITVMAVAVLNSLRRHLRTRADQPFGPGTRIASPGTRIASGGKPARI